jgi:DNA-3-methyladenine glycosylase
MEFEFLKQPAYVVAPQLLGCELVRTINNKVMRVKIIEVEAYDETDIASHSYKGKTMRTKVMFGKPGHLYVYFTYGMHYCCNIVTGKKGHGAAVLLRGVEPLQGVDLMKENRRSKSKYELTNGPAKLCQALQIDNQLNGHDLANLPLQLVINKPLNIDNITQTTRIGLSKGKEANWRFYITNNKYVSSR